MKALALCFGLVAATAASALPTPGSEGASYKCKELVVIGRLKNLGYEHVEMENDLIGHGWMTARVKVRQVLTGRVRERLVPVRYFGHTYYREDEDFLLVLAPIKGGYQITSARLLDGERPPRRLPPATDCRRSTES
jgi:integration host factor subunit beta